jgi:tripartite-type tricarboxylate transporter receptor subunit TctC
MTFDVTRRQFIATGAAAATLPLVGSQAEAQAAWPNKPIKIIAGYPAGGQTDLFARTYGDVISKKIGQPIVVENKAGAGGTVAALEVKRAPADGYTWQFTISTTLIMNRVLLKEVPYDTEKDFILISIMPSGSLPMVASAKSGAKNLKEFVEYCKKNDKVSVGTYAAGSYAHMAIAELNKQYGLKIEPVHYRGEAPMWADLAGQTLDGAIGSYGAAAAVLQGGRGQAIAVSRRRNPLLPNVQTFQEQGTTSKCFELTGFQSCSVPAGTPKEVVMKISELLVEAGKSDKVQEMMKTFGVDEPAMTFEATQKLYDAEKPIWLELVKSLGLEPT